MSADGLHWTQRPENKERLHAIRLKGAQTMKARNKKQKGKKAVHRRVQSTVGRGQKNAVLAPIVNEVANHAEGSNAEALIAFAFGHVEGWLQTYANSIDVSPRTITYRVGQLLLHKGRR